MRRNRTKARASLRLLRDSWKAASVRGGKARQEEERLYVWKGFCVKLEQETGGHWSWKSVMLIKQK